MRDPTSRLGVLRWLDTVAMPAIPEQITHDQLLRAMDALISCGPAVEKAVAGQLRPLIDDTLSVVFYDLTPSVSMAQVMSMMTCAPMA